ncbi:hypothetical protein B0I37DRAFT_412894 [Chaetomium sp. MPI-CAGE-AT-0009]|nr:hypothetical protein B0I37DRAFT_412894 [Chaetomium sp. MPI-CAGE-AT-0009]
MADGIASHDASTSVAVGSTASTTSNPVAPCTPVVLCPPAPPVALCAPVAPCTPHAGASTDASAARIGPYVPGSIPPPQISLRQPENGTTGQIVDKIMTPLQLPHRSPGHTKTVAMYCISYPDRPEVRELVPYSEILRHVSPRELERWEDELPQRAEEDKRRKAQARREQLNERRKRERERGPATEMVTRAKRRRTGTDLVGEPDTTLISGRS